MNKFRRKRLIVILLVVSFLWLAVLHMFTMQAMSRENHACITTAVENQNCGLPGSGTENFLSHLNALQNLLQVLPRVSLGILASLILLAMVFLAWGLLFSRNWGKLVSIRDKLRCVLETSSFQFNSQIGFWLKLFGKRDSARNLLWRGFKFAAIPLV